MFTKTNKYIIVKSLVAFALLFALVLTSFSTSIVNNNLNVQAAASSANLIIGMVDKGTNYEVSACLQSTSGVQHLTDSSTWFNYNSAQVTPNPTLVTRGIYNSTASHAPMGWVSVFPNTIYGMSTISTTDVAYSDSIVPTTGSGLIGRGAFDKIGNAPSTSITLNKGLFYSIEGALDPTTVNVINSNADCTLYGAMASSSTPSSSAAISSSMMSSSPISSSSSIMQSSVSPIVTPSSAMAAAASNTIRTGGSEYLMYSSVLALNIIGLVFYNKRRSKINKIDIN